jgi:hypothetical protein
MLSKPQQGVKIGSTSHVRVDSTSRELACTAIKTYTAGGQQLPDAFLFFGKNMAPWMLEALPQEDCLAMANEKASVTVPEWTLYVKKSLVPWVKAYREEHALDDANIVLWLDK